MSPVLNGSSAIRHFECGDAIEIRDGITLDFYTGLPHIFMSAPKLIGIPKCAQQIRIYVPCKNRALIQTLTLMCPAILKQQNQVVFINNSSAVGTFPIPISRIGHFAFPSK